MNKKEQEIFDFTMTLMSQKNKIFIKDDYEFQHSERCVEIPWVGYHFAKNNYKNVLDIGFS